MTPTRIPVHLVSPTKKMQQQRRQRTNLFHCMTRGGLRVKPWEGHPGHWEPTWEYHDGRALFRYGDEIAGKPGPHIIWERIGGHEILD